MTPFHYAVEYLEPADVESEESRLVRVVSFASRKERDHFVGGGALSRPMKNFRESVPSRHPFVTEAKRLGLFTEDGGVK